jgi:hypothetical protein
VQRRGSGQLPPPVTAADRGWWTFTLPGKYLDRVHGYINSSEYNNEKGKARSRPEDQGVDVPVHAVEVLAGQRESPPPAIGRCHRRRKLPTTPHGPKIRAIQKQEKAAVTMTMILARYARRGPSGRGRCCIRTS